MSILIGTQSPLSVLLGASEVSQIYLGTNLVWEKTPIQYIWTLYDAGFVEGVEWEANALPRIDYTEGATVTVSSTGTRMLITLSKSSTDYTYNAHVITTAPIAVPRTAERMCVSAKRGSNDGGTMNYGLLPANAENSYSTNNGGVLSGETSLTTTQTTYSFILPDNVKGARNLYPIINYQGKGYPRKDGYFYKVWFE